MSEHIKDFMPQVFHSMHSSSLNLSQKENALCVSKMAVSSSTSSTTESWRSPSLAVKVKKI